MYIRMYNLMHVHKDTPAYIYAHAHAHTHTVREREREREREERERERIDRQTHREIERQTVLWLFYVNFFVMCLPPPT